MYIGRIVAVGQTKGGQVFAGYRVSSRSFPNRSALPGDAKVSIVPKPGHEGDVLKNPYIAYNCVRIVRGGTVAVATNGSQTDPIAEKIAMGMPVRDALAFCSLAMDYEKDQYNTPRVSAVADAASGEGWLATVREDGIEVRRLPLAPGQYFYVATYEENSITTAQGGPLDAQTAPELCAFLLGGGRFAERTHPVTAVAAAWDGAAFRLAVQDAPGAPGAQG